MLEDQEGRNVQFYPFQEKFRTVVSKGVGKGVRNVSDTLKNAPMKFLL